LIIQCYSLVGRLRLAIFLSTGTVKMSIFFTLLLAHLIADFPLQTNRIFAMKLKSSRGIAIHVLIHMAVTALLIKEPLAHLPLLIILAVTHFLIDWLKLRYPTQRQVPGFLCDQVLHLIVLGVLTAAFTNIQSALPGWLLTAALYYAFIPPIIMFIWLLAIDEGQVKQQTGRCIYWAQQNLLPISQRVGLPLLFVVGLGIIFL
jgi:hypothetical protein